MGTGLFNRVYSLKENPLKHNKRMEIPAEILRKIDAYRPETPMVFRELYCYFILIKLGLPKKYCQKNAIYWANQDIRSETYEEESLSSTEIEIEEIFDEGDTL